MARALIVVLVAALAATAAGCGGSAGGDGGDDSAEISFLVFGDPAELKAYRNVIAAYREEKPDARVELVEASDRDDLIARLSTSIAGGSPPDVFLLNYRYYGQFAAKGAIEPLDDRVASSDAFGEDDFYREALDAFRWDGRLMCLPQNVSSLVVYYNRDLFERFGIPEPRDDWAWHEFVRTGAALTRDELGNPIQGQDPDAPGGGGGPVVRPAIYGIGVDPSLIRVAPFVWSNGGDIVDDQERPNRLTLDTLEAQVALREFVALRLQYGVVPTDTEAEAEDDEARFAHGRLAMLLDSRRAVPSLREAAQFDWDVAPLPRFKEAASILHSDGFCITKRSKHHEAAWSFVEFALSAGGQKIITATGRTVPSLRAVAESEAFLDPAKKPKRSQVWLDAIPNVRSVPTISTWPEIEDVVEGLLENALYVGKPTPEDLAKQAAAKTEPLFARAER